MAENDVERLQKFGELEQIVKIIEDRLNSANATLSGAYANYADNFKSQYEAYLPLTEAQGVNLKPQETDLLQKIQELAQNHDSFKALVQNDSSALQTPPEQNLAASLDALGLKGNIEFSLQDESMNIASPTKVDPLLATVDSRLPDREIIEPTALEQQTEASLSNPDPVESQEVPNPDELALVESQEVPKPVESEEDIALEGARNLFGNDDFEEEVRPAETQPSSGQNPEQENQKKQEETAAAAIEAAAIPQAIEDVTPEPEAKAGEEEDKDEKKDNAAAKDKDKKENITYSSNPLIQMLMSMGDDTEYFTKNIIMPKLKDMMARREEKPAEEVQQQQAPSEPLPANLSAVEVEAPAPAEEGARVSADIEASKAPVSEDVVAKADAPSSSPPELSVAANTPVPPKAQTWQDKLSKAWDATCDKAFKAVDTALEIKDAVDSVQSMSNSMK